MNAKYLVQRYAHSLIGRTVLTERIGEWPGGPAEVIKLNPDLQSRQTTARRTPKRRPSTQRMKILRITMPDDSEWDVPAALVAHDRAAYYASDATGQTSGEKHSEIYKQELAFTLGDNEELLDWAANNMNWNDVRKSATLHRAGKCDYQEGWVNGEKEVIET